MTVPKKSLAIVIADDDADDRLLIVEALKDIRINNPLVEVANGEELLLYLRRQGEYESVPKTQKDGMVLLDLNMPKMDGREALAAIEQDPALKHIPVIILTTSKAEEDVVKSYASGANSFIVKPVTATAFIEAIKALQHYWMEVVEIFAGE